MIEYARRVAGMFGLDPEKIQTAVQGKNFLSAIGQGQQVERLESQRRQLRVQREQEEERAQSPSTALP